METTAVPTTTQGEIQDEPDHASDPTGDGARDEPRSEPHNRELSRAQDSDLGEHYGASLESNGRGAGGSDEEHRGTRVVSHARIAPLPLPEELQGYDDVVPGAG